MASNSPTLHDVVIENSVGGSSPVLKGVLGIPAGNGPWPAVVVVHELFGVDAEMRKQVAHLASLGYLALMPDLFSAGGMRRCLVATMRSLTSGVGRAFADIEAARLYLLNRSEANGAVGVFGCCMGGGFALLTASGGDYAVASVNYGQLPRDLDAAVDGACPIVASYGGKDVTLTGAGPKLKAALERNSVPHDLKVYPDAGHVFMNEKLNGWPWLRPIVRVLNFGPNPEAARDAWQRVDAFFAEHLVAPKG